MNDYGQHAPGRGFGQDVSEADNPDGSRRQPGDPVGYDELYLAGDHLKNMQYMEPRLAGGRHTVRRATVLDTPEFFGDPALEEPPRAGIHARSALMIYEKKFNGFTPVAGGLSKWEVVRDAFRYLLARGIFDTAGSTVSMNDTAGVSRTFFKTNSSGQNPAFGLPNQVQTLSYGSGANSPSGTDQSIQTLIDSMTGIPTFADGSTWRASVGASKIYAGIGDTIRESTHYIQMYDSAGIGRTVCIDRSTANQAVGNGQTVALSYTWQF